jgi:hypothetical protein
MWLKSTHRVDGSMAPNEVQLALHFTELQSEGLALLHEVPMNHPLYEHPSLRTTIEGGFIGQLEQCPPGNKARQKGV